LLREEQKSRSKDAEMIENFQKEGKKVPSELLVGLVRKAMQAKGWSQKRFLIDGFPRNEENVRVWDQTMPDVEVLLLLFIRCTEEVMVQRILDRSQGQSDEKPESLKMKVRAFEAEIRPVLEIFRKKESEWTKSMEMGRLNMCFRRL
jgi:UMP-CMP kinase